MKILTSTQVRNADAYTIANEPIESIDLMERASWAFVATFLSLPLDQRAVTVVCGPGNNGGDGFAIARLLHQQNYQVAVWMVGTDSKLSKDCEINRKRWLDISGIFEIETPSQLKDLVIEGMVIDAIFGSGLNRDVSGLYQAVIDFINRSNGLVVAVDMPSGLFSERPGSKTTTIEAAYTLSFQTPKLAFFLPQNQRYVGHWHILEIGLDPHFIDQIPTDYFCMDAALVQGFNKSENKFAHKGCFGHALLVVGGEGKIGAAVLAARGAMKGGLGLLTVHIPRCGLSILQMTVPEAMCQADPDERCCTDIIVSDSITTIGIGPGIGVSKATVNGFRKLLQNAAGPMVIDADGINILSQHRELLEIVPKGSILTPHPKEFERLAGSFNDDYQRLQLQSEFARKFEVIVVYKGAHTTIATQEGKLFFNTTGNMGMATAGSGDVLAGLVTGLLTRTGDSLLAAIAGVFIHGLAGDLAAEADSKVSMTAGDILLHIGPAIKKTNLQL